MVWPSPLPVTKHVRHPEEIPSPGRCHSPPPPQPCSLGPAFCLHRFACWGRFTWWLLTVRGFHVWLLSLCTMCSRLAHPWQVSALQPPWPGRVCCLGTQAVASICLPSVCPSVLYWQTSSTGEDVGASRMSHIVAGSAVWGSKLAPVCKSWKLACPALIHFTHAQGK